MHASTLGLLFACKGHAIFELSTALLVAQGNVARFLAGVTLVAKRCNRFFNRAPVALPCEVGQVPCSRFLTMESNEADRRTAFQHRLTRSAGAHTLLRGGSCSTLR